MSTDDYGAPRKQTHAEAVRDQLDAMERLLGCWPATCTLDATDDDAEERAAEARGEYMTWRERGELSDWRADADERAAEQGWGA